MITDLLLCTETAAFVVAYGVLPIRRRIARRRPRATVERPDFDLQPIVSSTLQAGASVTGAATGVLGSVNVTAERARQIAPGASDAIDPIVDLTRERTISLIRAFQKEQI